MQILQGTDGMLQNFWNVKNKNQSWFLSINCSLIKIIIFVRLVV